MHPFAQTDQTGIFPPDVTARCSRQPANFSRSPAWAKILSTRYLAMAKDAVAAAKNITDVKYAIRISKAEIVDQ